MLNAGSDAALLQCLHTNDAAMSCDHDGMCWNSATSSSDGNSAQPSIDVVVYSHKFARQCVFDRQIGFC